MSKLLFLSQQLEIVSSLPVARVQLYRSEVRLLSFIKLTPTMIQNSCIQRITTTTVQQAFICQLYSCCINSKNRQTILWKNMMIRTSFHFLRLCHMSRLLGWLLNVPSTHYRSFRGRLKQLLVEIRLESHQNHPPCYNNTTLGNHLHAWRKGPNVTNPIRWTCKNCSYKCATNCKHCVTQSSTEQF